MKRTLIKVAIAVFALILSVSATFIIFTAPSLNSKCGNNVVAGGNSKVGGQFKLTNSDSKTVNSKNFITEPALIYFGYSFCPDVCPFDLQRNVLSVDILHDQGIEIQPIFITIDPQRDTPNRLKEFEAFVHPKLIGLTGAKHEITEVMKMFKVYGKKSNKENLDKNDYLMDHSAFTYLVNQEGEFIDYFSRKISAEQMALQIKCYLK